MLSSPSASARNQHSRPVRRGQLHGRREKVAARWKTRSIWSTAGPERWSRALYNSSSAVFSSQPPKRVAFAAIIGDANVGPDWVRMPMLSWLSAMQVGDQQFGLAVAVVVGSRDRTG